jgi:hypothetical protein
MKFHYFQVTATNTATQEKEFGIYDHRFLMRKYPILKSLFENYTEGELYLKLTVDTNLIEIQSTEDSLKD